MFVVVCLLGVDCGCQWFVAVCCCSLFDAVVCGLLLIVVRYLLVGCALSVVCCLLRAECFLPFAGVVVCCLFVVV